MTEEARNLFGAGAAGVSVGALTLNAMTILFRGGAGVGTNLSLYETLPSCWGPLSAGQSHGVRRGGRIPAIELLADVPRQYSLGGGLRYAICDGRRDDDIKIGIKSAAILFGRYDT